MKITSKENCYDLSLGLKLHLGKDLRVERRLCQLVKRKEYRGISILYICSSHEKTIQST